VLDGFSREAGLTGVFVIEDSPKPPFIENDCLMIGERSLKMLDELLETPESDSWRKGIRYLVIFLKSEKEAREHKRFEGTDSISMAHLKAWSVLADDAEKEEGTARALLILEYLKKGETHHASISKESIEIQFGLLDEKVVERIVEMIESIQKK